MKPIQLLLFSFILLLFPTSGASRQILPSEAQNIAAKVLGTSSKDRQLRKVGGKEQQSPYYIFNRTDVEKFAIVAGDDRMPEILAYGDSTMIDADDMPPQLIDMLQYYEFIYDNISTTEINTPRNTEPILLKTANWNQGYPYNKYCPKGCLTGCGATATAIVMKYHGYPNRGTGSHSYSWNNETLSANFDEVLEWDKTLLNYTKGEFSTEQADAVAKIMKKCGVMLEMNYGIDVSSCSISKSELLAKYMSYSSKCESISSQGVTDEQWYKLIDNELDNNRPILYRGADINNNNGHIFVIDGRNETGLYHVNWGWGGNANGYFSLLNLNPTSRDDYRYYHWMTINASPECDGEFMPLIVRSEKGSFGLTYNRERVLAGENFIATIPHLENHDDTTIDGEVAIVLTNASGEIREFIGSDNFSLLSGYYYYSFSLTTYPRLNAQPSDMLKVVYKPTGETVWKDVAPFAFTQTTVSAYDFSPAYVPVEWDVDSRISVTPYLQDLDRILQFSRYSFRLTNDEPINDDVVVTVNDQVLECDDAGWYQINFAYAPSYKIKITVGPDESAIAETTADYLTEIKIYNISGQLIATLTGQSELDDYKNRLSPGIYLVQRGSECKKMLITQ